MYKFVVHEHHARQLHYDFRLEISGVLKSWAIPKGPSLNPSDKRLAILVDDHPLNYFDFEGIFPENGYGAGAVVIWDAGTYELIDEKNPETTFQNGKIRLKLYGNILQGEFSLIQMKGKGKKNWLLIKKKDSFSKTGYKISQALTTEKHHKLKVRKPPCENGPNS